MREICQESVATYAKSIGFDLVGFTSPTIEPKYLEALRSWQSAGHHADMAYMEEFEKRADLTKVLPGVKTVIVLALNYYYEQSPLKPSSGRVARYAYGRDYHKIITKKLKALCTHLTALDPTATHKPYVDTGPVLERALAEQAGIGTIGKNTLLITREFGSWVFLCEILTTLDLGLSGQPENQNRPGQPKPFPRPFGICGQCTKCIDACPTGAIISPGVVDSRRCISYLTIENRGEIPPALARKIAKTKRLFGCDICQEVCPHNGAKQKPHQNSELKDPKIAGDQLPLAPLLKTCTSPSARAENWSRDQSRAQKRENIISPQNTEPRNSCRRKTSGRPENLPTAAPTADAAFLARFAGSPLMRAKRRGLERNVDVIKPAYLSQINAPPS